MKIKNKKSIVLFICIICMFFGLANNAKADYETYGLFVSTNLLVSSGAEIINSFSYTITIPAGTTASVQFSLDGAIWYNSSGVLDGSNTLTAGTNTIDLSARGWIGSSFYYRMIFTSDGTNTPALDTITLSYISFTGVYNVYSTTGSFTSTNLLTGQTAVTIDNFVYNLTSLPPSTTTTIQFSNDNATWYNSSGVLDSSNTLSAGTNTINLSALVWSGSNFYYKIAFTSNGTYTPILDSITLNYTYIPTLTNISTSPNPIKGGETITITPTGQGDANSNALNYYCNEWGTAGGHAPMNDDYNRCTQGNASYTSPYSTMTCSYAVATGDTTRNVYCRTYDGTDYSIERTSTYLVDTTVPAIASTTFSGFTTSSTFIKGTGTIIGGTAEDTGGSGVDTTTCEYTIDNGSNWLAGAWSTNHCQKTSITISNEVSYTFNTRVKDLVVNQGTGTATSTYTGDTQAPSTTDNSNTTWHNTNQTITLTPSDGTGSGVAHTYYCVYNFGDTVCTPSTEGATVIVSCTAGNNCHQYVRYYSTDNLDNTEAIKTSSLIRIDKINPIVSAGDNYATGSTTGQSVEFTQVGTATDPDIGAESGSGIATYLWQKVSGPGSITFGSATQTSTTIWSPTDGTYVISLTATDNAGNTSTDDFTLLWSTTLPSTSTIDTTRIGGNNMQRFVATNYNQTNNQEIQRLQAIIEKLKAQIIALIKKNTPQPTITPNMPIADMPENTPQSPSSFQFTSTLKLGSMGSEVKQLQIKLQTLGFLANTITPNGVFGKATLKALQDFQTQNNITSPDIYGYGIVGPKTRAVLNGVR